MDSANILGGINVLPKEYPYYLRITLNDNLQTVCGAVLIAEYFALTAAHCNIDPDVHSVNGGSVTMVVGEKIYPIEEVHNHSNLRTADPPNTNFLYYDAALLCLKEAVVYTEFLKPINLPRKESSYISKTVTVLGAGLSRDHGATSTVLQKYSSTVVSLKECGRLILGLDKVSDHLSHGCYKTEVGGSACDGDSGGPVVFADPKSHSGVLVGIFSATIRPCGKTASADVYTRAQAVVGAFDRVKADFLRRKSSA